MNKRNVITALLALAVTMFTQAQNLIKNATASVSFSKSDFADTIAGRLLHFPTIKIDQLPVNDLYITTAVQAIT